MISVTSANAHFQQRPKDTAGCCPACAQPLPDHSSIVVDPQGGTILRNGNLVSLTTREMEVFFAIYRHKPHVVSVDRVFMQVIDRDDEVEESWIRQVVSLINKKIRQIGLELASVPARGYRVVVTGS